MAILARLGTPGCVPAMRSWATTMPARTGHSLLVLSVLALLLPAGARGDVPVVQTYSDGTDDDQDEMSVWVHPTNPTQSTLIASDKSGGTVYVYDLAGNVIQKFSSPQPGNIDVRYGVRLGAQCVDVVAFNERTENRIRVYKVNPSTRRLDRVDDGAITTSGGNYGFTLYRHGDGRLFAHTGPDGNGSVVRQYELIDNGAGQIHGVLTGWQFDETTVEGMAGDDETGYLYLGEEGRGVWRVDALDDTDKTLIAQIGDASGLAGDVEGITIYYAAGGAGYIIVSSQGADKFTILRRQPPHAPVGEFSLAGVGSTDGIDVLNMNLGSPFSQGIFAAHNGASCCPVQAARWADVATEVGALLVDTSYWYPRQSNRDCDSSSVTTTTLPSAEVTLEEIQTGASSGTAAVVTEASLTAAQASLYLAAVGTKPAIAVTGFAGLNLAWSPVVEQCSGRSQTGAALWMASGSPAASGPVTASLEEPATNAVIVVSRYSGVTQATPIGAAASANTNGEAGACAGGVDSGSYSLDLASGAGSTVYAAAAMRHANHAPGAGFVERAEIHQGTLGNVASLAIQDRPPDGAPATNAAGSFDGAVDWATVAVALRGGGATPRAALCGTAPESPANCHLTEAGKSSLRMSSQPRATITWKWKRGAATDLASFDDPLAGTAEYRLCLYDSSAGTQPLAELALRTGASCDGESCWSDIGAKGFRYRDRSGIPDGVAKAKLRPGAAGKAQIQIKGTGTRLPPLHLDASGLDLPVTAQFLVVRDSGNECWQSTFSAAKRNDESAFQATGP
jgi:3-phytase